MNAHDMWQAYTAIHPEAENVPHEVWAYGDAPDKLASLTLAGIKRGTSSAHALYALTDEPVPQIGDYSIILDSKGEAVCITRINWVRILPFCEVDEHHAYLEGEGDCTLAYWREVHERFFRRELAEYHLFFTEDIAVVCEEFEVMYP